MQLRDWKILKIQRESMRRVLPVVFMVNVGAKHYLKIQNIYEVNVNIIVVFRFLYYDTIADFDPTFIVCCLSLYE